jgi:hypothetical protein
MGMAFFAACAGKQAKRTAAIQKIRNMIRGPCTEQ